MRITGADERDSGWEDHRPRFRVYFFGSGDAPDSLWDTDTYDVTDGDVLEVIQWAQHHAGAEQLYAVALVGQDKTEPAHECRGLTWLVGMDANDTPTDEAERRRLSRRCWTGAASKSSISAEDPLRTGAPARRCPLHRERFTKAVVVGLVSSG